MVEPLSLRLLYTAHIAGDLALLPRLFSFIQRLKAEAPAPALLLDLGRSCSADVWHCRVTGGRSTLVALDGMGYQAANVAGLLDSEERDKLARQVTMALVDERRDWHFQLPDCDAGIFARLRPRADGARLQILLAPAEATRIEGNALYLQAVGAGQVGEAALDLRDAPRLISARKYDMPPDSPPNPSIAATVEFVEAEARLLAKKRGIRGAAESREI